MIVPIMHKWLQMNTSVIVMANFESNLSKPAYSKVVLYEEG